MSHNYKVNFAFEHKDSDDRPESEKHGFGVMDIITDEEPTTDEDFKEIARTIGHTGDFKKVVIQTVTANDNIIDDSGEVLEGEIVID